MLTYSPGYGTSDVHVESGFEGMAVCVVTRLLQLPHFFHFVEIPLQGLRGQCKNIKCGLTFKIC